MFTIVLVILKEQWSAQPISLSAQYEVDSSIIVYPDLLRSMYVYPLIHSWIVLSDAMAGMGPSSSRGSKLVFHIRILSE
jgi:hypothetical protein